MSTESLDLNHDNSFTDPSENTASLEIVSINKSELFDNNQCQEILNSCIEELWLKSTVVGSSELHSSRRQKLRGDVQAFPFLNIRDVTKLANTKIYDFNLLGIIDQDYPQIFKYSEGDFYNWHIDLNPLAPSRKLTFIINLSTNDSYEGGNIEFLNTDTSSVDVSEQGSCLIFPSYTPYRITPVTKGIKYIIIGHVHGNIFK
jgi:PKHD-type hydroxylase